MAQAQDVRIEKTGRNIYRIHRADRECFGEEYMLARQHGPGGGNTRISHIYLLKRYMLFVIVDGQAAVRRMVPHTDLPNVLLALGFPARAAVAFSQDGADPRSIDMLPTLHQTLREHSVNTIHLSAAPRGSPA